MSMHILCLGINHIFAPLQLREKVGFDEDRIRAAFSRLLHRQDDAALQEMVILSTCNRVEIYAASPVLDFAELEMFLLEATPLWSLNRTTAVAPISMAVPQHSASPCAKWPSPTE